MSHPEAVKAWCLDCLAETRLKEDHEEGYISPVWVSECCGTQKWQQDPLEPEVFYRDLALYLKHNPEGLEKASKLWESLQ